MQLVLLIDILLRGCSAAEEYFPLDHEIADLNPAGRSGFFFTFLSGFSNVRNHCAFNQVPQGGASL